MRKIVRALLGVAMVFAVGAAASCSLNGIEGPVPERGSVDGWGNPLPTDENGLEACAVPSGPGTPYVPYAGGRPADVRPGNSWIVFELTARALPPNDGTGPLGAHAYDYCVPINVHVYTRPGEADTVQVGSAGFEAGPFDFRTTTPWTGRYVALQYDPTEERFAAAAPAYEVHLQVKYDVERDMTATDLPTALACTVRTHDGSAIIADTAVLPQRDAVACVLTGNSGWRLY